MIDGVVILPLKRIRDDLGAVMHVLRSDSPTYEQFGEVYCSVVNPRAIKAWKKHKKMSQNMAVPSGEIKLIIYDDRDSSRSKGIIEEIHTGENAYQLIHIPPLTWYGFQGISSYPAMIVNCTTCPHDPNEVERLPNNDPLIPYSW